MITHSLGKGGNNPCQNASPEARKVAKQLKKGKRKRGQEESEDDTDDEDAKKQGKRKLLTKVENLFKQSQLKVFRGIAVPFTPEKEATVCKQFLRATDPEIVTLFLLFRSTACNVMPSPYQVSGKLLDDANAAVTKDLQAALRDGWKDESRDSVNGVNLSLGGKTYLVNLILATAHKKDGASMCKAFEEMIDEAEEVYGVHVVAFCCDNNGGSQRGRKDLVLKRPHLFGPPCCAHQFQLILGEYFEENEEAAATAEEATGLIGWVNSHGRVRTIFNDAQQEFLGKKLAFLVANMTRWTTHFIAFDRLHDLKDSMRRAVIQRKEDIISAQVRAEKNCQKRQKLEGTATAHCELIDDGGFWRRLKSVVDDLEPICLGLNKNQTDALRPDQALLTFAGIFLYFQKHSKRSVANGMTSRIEKRCKALANQCISRFGDKAATYQRVCSRPPKVPRSNVEEHEYEATREGKEREVSESFMSYLSSKGPFKDWEKNKELFQHVHAFINTPSVCELADFAILLLGMSVNQAGLEHSFSDLKIKKTWLWNFTPRFTLIARSFISFSQVGADIWVSHQEAGFVAARTKHQNHDNTHIANLLSVPRYADLLEQDGDTSEDEEGPVEHWSGMIKSRKAWRREIVKWVQEERAQSDNDDDEVADVAYSWGRSKWLPRSLNLLFGGRNETDIDQQIRQIRRQQAYTEEARLMELLAAEEEDVERIPDDGELEGLGDDYDG
ncbi:hypothetical protein B0H34DRAFT_791004 [Crassisporium funariophilum]|nr:hypothetical protein B0H34DRAFT_791004 [Crassisporium funariophilum]